MTAASTLIVGVTRQPGPTDLYTYELRPPNLDTYGPVHQEYFADVGKVAAGSLCAKINELLKDAPSSATDRLGELAELGNMLYRTLFPLNQGKPSELATHLGQLERPLLIRTSESDIPWELLHDGEEFLGLKHDMGRHVVVNTWVARGRDIGSIGRVLIVGDPLGDLGEARNEAEHLTAWLRERGINPKVLIGDQATHLSVQRELDSGAYDLFHYCGHVGVPFKGTTPGLVLHGRELLDKSSLSPLATDAMPPVVFINGCASADRVKNLCMPFMERGAKVIIGTRYVVNEHPAQQFADRFYSELLKETPVGAAVRAARSVLRDGDTTDWTSFVLYADPAVRVTAELPPPPPPPPPTRRLDEQARELMGRVIQRAAMKGLASSVDLLVELLATEALRARLADRDKARLTAAIEFLETMSDNSSPAEEPEAPNVEYSDTVASVLARAEQRAQEAGRKLATVEDIVDAFVAVGGGSSGYLLELLDISLPRNPSDEGGDGQQGQQLFDARGILRTDLLDPPVVAAVRMAGVVAAKKGAIIGTSTLLHGLSITGSDVLRDALLELGDDGRAAIHQLSAWTTTRKRHFSPRTQRALERAAAQGPGRGEAALLRELLSEQDSAAHKLLQKVQIDPDQLLQALPPGHRDDTADGEG